MDIESIKKHLKEGESETLEFKKSTGQLNRAGETLCAFLNGKGGTVYIGVKPDTTLVGQEISDSTLRDIARTLDQFDPKAPISQDIIPLGRNTKLIILTAPSFLEAGPFTFKGRPYQRIGNTTSVMPRSGYESLLFRKNHSRIRWENAYAEWHDMDCLDQEEILRTVRFGIETGRLPESTGKDINDILDRLGLRNKEYLLNAAIVLFGKKFLPAYPQCQLRLARFKGKDKSTFLDHKQVRGHAFELLNEAMTFLRGHLPVSGHFEENRLERIDKPGLPPLALREALVNAICHRDYSIPGGAVSIAIYDDRTEIWSDGSLPFGLKPEDLSREHTSKPRNPLITDVFFRCGLIEQWGRGTQKIIELCQKAGYKTPEFEETAGALMVRFPLYEKSTPQDTPQDNTQVTNQDNTQVKPELKRLLEVLDGEMSRTELQAGLKLRNIKNFRMRYLFPAIKQELIEMTIPDKPNSKNQRYRLTDKGKVIQKQLKK
ncbi:MAG: ATP-binding protein [Bacteroidales bacterium]